MFDETFNNYDFHEVVKYNGKKVSARLSDDFTEFCVGKFYDLRVSDDLIQKTAKEIFNIVKEHGTDTNDSFILDIKFKDDKLKELIDYDYSKSFVTNERCAFDDNEFDYTDIEGKEVDYDDDELTSEILSYYRTLYTPYTEGLFDSFMLEELHDIGFDELCKDKGFEETPDIDIDRYYFFYDGDTFTFHIKVYIN